MYALSAIWSKLSTWWCQLSGCSRSLSQVLKRDAEGSVKRVENAKVAVFAQGVDTTSTETKVQWSAEIPKYPMH